MSNHLSEIVLIGAGSMAIEYAKVLKALNCSFTCVGRNLHSAVKFQKQTGVPAEIGGLRAYLKKHRSLPSKAIVAVNVENMCEVTLLLLENGVKTILMEKPGGLNAGEIKKILDRSIQYGATVYVAYNRRFYASTERAKDIAEREGGIVSFHFNFTELSDQIANSNIHSAVKENWLLANSTHVIDTAFYLGGEPSFMKCHISRSLSWHPSAAVFTGSGFTKSNALFSYHANWLSPGRWGIELMTCKSRLILQPMEELYIQRKGSFQMEKVSLNKKWDQTFKPGLYLLVKSFIRQQNDSRLLTIVEHYFRTLSIYEKIKSRREW